MTPLRWPLVGLVLISLSSCCARSRPSPFEAGKALIAHQPRRHFSASSVRLKIEFIPQLNDDGSPMMSQGKTVVSYVPEGATVDAQDNVNARADIIIRSIPRTPNRFFGYLVSPKGDIRFIPSNRIVTNQHGICRVTLDTWNDEGSWDVAIHRVRGR